MIEIDVRAHRPVICRKRYRPACQCPGNSGNAAEAAVPEPDAGFLLIWGWLTLVDLRIRR